MELFRAFCSTNYTLASTFGYIMSAVGVGWVIGTVFLASRKPGAQLRKIPFSSTIIMGLGLIGFSQATNFPLALFFAAIVGIGAVSQFTVCNIVVLGLGGLKIAPTLFKHKP